MKKTNKEIIGRLEIVDLPKWDIKEYEKNGAKWVKFNLLDPEHPSYNERLFSLPVSDIREVKSSNGQTELRVFIKTKIIFFNKEHDIELSLTNRSEMKYPILVGRKFLKNKFLVDVSKKNLSEKEEN